MTKLIASPSVKLAHVISRVPFNNIKSTGTCYKRLHIVFVCPCQVVVLLSPHRLQACPLISTRAFNSTTKPPNLQLISVSCWGWGSLQSQLNALILHGCCECSMLGLLATCQMRTNHSQIHTSLCMHAWASQGCRRTNLGPYLRLILGLHVCLGG